MLERQYFSSGILLVFILALSLDIKAVVSIGKDIELEGFLKIQNILRTPKFKEAEAIMQRNTLQLESKYYFLKEGKNHKIGKDRHLLYKSDMLPIDL